MKGEDRMLATLLTPVLGVSLLNVSSLPINAMNQIYEITKNVFPIYTMTPSIHGSDVIIHFENENQIGVAWFEPTKENKNWSYNYVRFDTTGRILIDLRNVIVKKDYSDEFVQNWHLGVPHLEYVIDNAHNVWLIYSYDTEDGRRIGWIKVDSTSKVVENKSLDQEVGRNFIAGPSKSGFHLFLHPMGFQYFNPHLSKATSMLERYEKPYPYPPVVCIETRGGNALFIGYPYYRYQRILQYQQISAAGSLVSVKSVNVDEYTTWSWNDVDLPAFNEIYQDDDGLIYCVRCDGNSLRIVIFTKDGEIIKPKKQQEGHVLSIDQMPHKAHRSMKIYKTVIYYFGIDNEGNLYYWNSKETEK